MNEHASMHYPNTVEFQAQQEVLKHIAPLAAQAARTDTLFERATTTIAEHATPGPRAKVVLILLARIANDFRVCGLTSSLGYGLQAFGLAASMMEILGALAFVGDSEDRAIKWAEHKDLGHSYPPTVKEGIDAALTALGISDPAARDDWQKAYKHMCMAKHANPKLSMLQGLYTQPSGLHHVFGPDTTQLGVFLAAEALSRAIRYSTAAILVAAQHCSDESLRQLLRDESRDIQSKVNSLEPLLSQLERSAMAAA